MRHFKIFLSFTLYLNLNGEGEAEPVVTLCKHSVPRYPLLLLSDILSRHCILSGEAQRLCLVARVGNEIIGEDFPSWNILRNRLLRIL